MKKLWLIFAQATTITLAIVFSIQVLKPDWMGRSYTGVTTSVTPVIRETNSAATSPRSSTSYADAAKEAVPAVVYIYTRQTIKNRRDTFSNDPLFRHFFGDRDPDEGEAQEGLGSGVVVSTDGLILTNNHVVEGADEIEVASSDGHKYPARVIGTDPESDLAVVKIKAQAALPAIAFAPSDSLRVGDVVLAIGNPFGVGESVTMGIVSALGRSQLGINTFENFIQTDAAINPGNSGGALVDSNGALVGINTAIYSQNGGSMGIGFAIPVSLARVVMEQIIKNGSVTRGWIGVEVQEVTPELANSFNLPNSEGAIITGVVRSSPADRAGIRPGDVLLAINEHPVKNSQAMLDLVAALAPNESAQFKLRRNSKDLQVKVTVAKRPRPREDGRR